MMKFTIFIYLFENLIVDLIAAIIGLLLLI